MGCHTWIYRKIAVADDVKQRMKEKFEEKYNDLFTLSNEELFNKHKKELRERFPDVSEEIIEPNFTLEEYAEGLEETRKEIKRDNILEQIRNNDFTNAQLLIDFDDFIENPENEIIQFYNRDFYIEDDEIGCDLFRVDYNENMFTDAESLISWLETQNYVGYYKDRENIGLCDELRDEIRKLFDEHPDILIDFG